MSITPPAPAHDRPAATGRSWKAAHSKNLDDPPAERNPAMAAEIFGTPMPHEFVPDERHAGEGMCCGWCGVTEAEMEAANGRLDLCGLTSWDRLDGCRD